MPTAVIPSCSDEDESRNTGFDVAQLKRAIRTLRWDDKAVSAVVEKNRVGSVVLFDPALCVDGQPVTKVLLDSYLASTSASSRSTQTGRVFEPAIRSLLLAMLEHGVNPNTAAHGSTNDSDESATIPPTPAPLAVVLSHTPYDVALVRALLMGGHALTKPNLGPETPTYLHMLPDIHRKVRHVVAQHVGKARYMVRHGSATSLENAFQRLARAYEEEEIEACIVADGDGAEACSDRPNSSTNHHHHDEHTSTTAEFIMLGDPRVVMDGLFELSHKFQDMDFELVEFLQRVQRGAEDPRKVDRHVGASDASAVATECTRGLLGLMLHSPAAQDMLAAAQLLLEAPSTGENMLHAVMAIGDVEVLGLFTDKLKTTLLDAVAAREELLDPVSECVRA